MDCKNCGNSLRSDFGFCPNCGAKVIRNRLTLKNVWEDLSFQVFNLDNTFFKTFRHLFTKPHEVVLGFVSGARKKYMNPISYFAIGITLSGFTIFILRSVYKINLFENNFGNNNAPDMEFIFDYQGLLSYLFMPVYAAMTWVLFLDKKQLNYTEHLVANAYVYGQSFLIQFMVLIPLFGFFDLNYAIVNYIFLVVLTAYLFYVLKKTHTIGTFSTILRGIAYLVLLVVIFFIIGILGFLIMLLTGAIDIQDFAPK